MYGYFSASKKSAERRWLSRISVRVSTLATSIWSWPVILVASSSGPSKLPSNLLNWPRTVDTARCLAVKPTVVCILSISYLTIWSSWNFWRSVSAPTRIYLLAQATIPGGRDRWALALLQAEPGGRCAHHGRRARFAGLGPKKVPGLAEPLSELRLAHAGRYGWQRVRELHHVETRPGRCQWRHAFGVPRTLI